MHCYFLRGNVFMDYLRTAVSPKSGLEIYQSSPVVKKSKFNVVISSGVFMLLASECWLASSGHNPHVKFRGLDKTGMLPLVTGWKKVPQSEGFSWSENGFLSFAGMVLFFCTCITPTSSQIKLGGHCTRMLCAVFNVSWKQHPTKHQLYGHSHLTNYPRWAKHAGHGWRSKDKLKSNLLQWTSTYGHTSIGQLAKICIHPLCVDTGCHLEDLPGVMANRDGWQVRVKGIHAVGLSW